MQSNFSLQRAVTAVSCTAFAVLLGLASHAQGQTTAYYSTFDNLQKNNTLSDQDGWTDTDTNQPDSVAIFGGYSATPTDNLASLGGAYLSSDGGPSAATAYLSHAFTPLPAAGGYYLSTDFAVTSSSAPYTNDNSFGFAFHGATGTLFSVDLVPNATTGASAENVRYSVYSDPVTNTFTQTASGKAVPLNSRYHLVVSVNSIANTFSFTLQPESATGTINGIMFTSPTIPLTTLGAGALVTSFGAVYNVAPSADGVIPGSGAGSNTLLFDNLGVVPEPSTWIMLGLGIVAVMVRFRRKAARA